jgi:hypothetical protein
METRWRLLPEAVEASKEPIHCWLRGEMSDDELADWLIDEGVNPSDKVILRLRGGWRKVESLGFHRWIRTRRGPN